MKPIVMILATSLLSGFSYGMTAQTDSLVDVFPLAIGNQWTYRYFTLTVIWPSGNPVETRTDSGRVVYHVSGRVENGDSTRWQFMLRRDLARHQILWSVGGDPRDTIYSIRDSSLFELIENHQGQHQLYRNEDPGTIHLDVFPFTRRFTDTTLIYRFRRVGSGDTISFKSVLYNGFPTSTRNTFTFKGANGLQRFRYHSGSFDVYDTAHHYLLGNVITSAGETTTKSQPEQYGMAQNYPNPFNPTTTIQFTVKSRESVSVKVYDLLGREVATLMNDVMTPGDHEVRWDGTDFTSGVYIVELRVGSFVSTRKAVLVK